MVCSYNLLINDNVIQHINRKHGQFFQSFTPSLWLLYFRSTNCAVLWDVYCKTHGFSAKPIKVVMAILEIDHIVKFCPAMSGGTEVWFTGVTCVVKYARWVGVRRYINMSKVTCRYGGTVARRQHVGTVTYWRTKCHDGTPDGTVERLCHGRALGGTAAQ